MLLPHSLDSTGQALATMAIPALPALVGFRWYLQDWVSDRSIAGGVAGRSGLLMVIG
jgi:hypothetical protein